MAALPPSDRCVLCGYAVEAGEACPGGHRMCSRCHRACWAGQQTILAAGGDDGALAMALCPEPGCYQTLGEPPADAPKPGHSRLVRVAENTPEFETATARFYATIGVQATVERVFRVENPTLSDMFELCRVRMTQETRDVTEKQMFHGTDRAAAGSIARSGFDIRYSGKNAEVLGPGIYLADDASYSHSFAVEDYGGHLCMIVARVLPGRTPGNAEKAAKRGARQEQGANYFDSTVAGGILAVRREQQALPVYIIYYHV